MNNEVFRSIDFFITCNSLISGAHAFKKALLFESEHYLVFYQFIIINSHGN